ncbi:hypothetical protein CFP56_031442 [Quercus suber]|uniref:Uncharacterized protein n=1 Tax=Quercus suber TaxID=58331 RepID=A0AAW0LTE6_QUESU
MTYIARQFFMGKVSKYSIILQLLKYLNLSHNQINGEIPNSPMFLSTLAIDLSSKNLKGRYLVYPPRVIIGKIFLCITLQIQLMRRSSNVTCNSKKKRAMQSFKALTNPSNRLLNVTTLESLVPLLKLEGVELCTKLLGGQCV